jgi:RHS repeat-associated protein
VHDFDGDGRDDLMLRKMGMPETIDGVYGWTRTYEIAVLRLHARQLTVDPIDPVLPLWGKKIDANGDGLADVIVREGDSERLRLHLAHGRGHAQYFDESPAFPGVSLDLFEYAFVWDSDFDGRGELFIPQEEAERWVQVKPLVADGTGAPTWTATATELPYTVRHLEKGGALGPYDSHTAYNWQGPVVMDLDGDGVPELVMRAGKTTDPVFEVWRAGASPRSGMLERIRDGFGQTTTISYRVGHIAAGEGCSYPLECVTKLPYAVVDSHSVSGSGSSSDIKLEGVATQIARRFEYGYENARRDVRGRGWLGFEKRVVKEVEADFPGTTISETIYEYDLDAEDSKIKLRYGAGRPWRVTQKSTLRGEQTGNLETIEYVSTDIYTWQVRSSKHRPWIALMAHESSRSENSVPLEKITRSFDYDGYGNRTFEATVYPDDRVDSTSITYLKETDEGGVLAFSRGQTGLATSVVKLSRLNASKPLVMQRFKQVSIEMEHDPLGRLEAVRRKIGSIEEESTTFAYDHVGNITDVTRTGRDAVQTVAHLRYDANGMFPEESWSDHSERLGLPHIQLGFDPAYGSMRFARQADGSWQTWNYDAFGRLVSTKDSSGGSSHVAYGWSPLKGAAFRVMRSGVAQPKESTEYNAFGLPLRSTYQDDSDNPASSVEYGYDDKGRQIRVTVPHFVDADIAGVHTTTYDDLGRVIAESHPYTTTGNSVWNAPVKYRYVSRAQSSGNLSELGAWASVSGAVRAVIATDPADYSTTTYLNARGEVVATADALRNFTHLSYGPFSHLEERTLLGVKASFESDSLGRVTKVTSPGSGVHEYIRNGFGQVRTYKHNQQPTTYQYDALGRVIHSDTPDGAYDWVYDGDGTDPSFAGKLVSESLTSASMGNASTHYTYHGPSASLSEIRREIAGTTYTTGLEYDNFGRPEVIRYPTTGSADGFAIQYQYGSLGRVDKVFDPAQPSQPYWQSLAVDAFGVDSEVRLFNGLREKRTLEPGTGRLQRFDVLDASDRSVQATGYGYNDRGLLWLRYAEHLGLAESFSYDGLGRLQERAVNDENNKERYEYDAHGNLTRKPGIGELYYADPKHPYAVTGTQDGRSFEYDSAGHGTQTVRQGTGVPGGRQKLDYTAFDLPKSIEQGLEGESKAVTRYQYDASHRRVVEDAPDGTRTVSVGDLYDRITTRDGGRLQVVRVPSPTGVAVELTLHDDGQKDVRVLHTDSLGSTTGISNGSGALRGSAMYEPFGTRWAQGDMSGVRAGFTGHHDDAGVGLVNMRGRIYDPALGRFLTPDPVVQGIAGSQGWNSYSYVHNNPLNFVDPSGFQAADLDSLPPDVVGDDHYVQGNVPAAPTPPATPTSAPAPYAVNQAADSEVPPGLQAPAAPAAPALPPAPGLPPPGAAAAPPVPSLEAPWDDLSLTDKFRSALSDFEELAVPHPHTGLGAVVPDGFRDRSIPHAIVALMLNDPGIPVLIGGVGGNGSAALRALRAIAGVQAPRGAPVVNMGKQGKHILGHNNYTPGRSILKADPNKLAQRAGSGTPVGSTPRGQAGFKERIDFGEIIGDFVKDGVATPTSNGIITYAKDGSIHIIPAAP